MEEEAAPTAGPVVPASPYLKVAQFAERWQVSGRLVRSWIGCGMPHVDLGSDIRVPFADADAWVRAGGPRKSSRRRSR